VVAVSFAGDEPPVAQGGRTADVEPAVSNG